MSSYLELVQQLHRDCGAAGTEPAAVTGLTGEAKRLANWIKRADEYVQLKWVNWKFLRMTYSVATVASTATAAKPTGLKYWDFQTFKIIEPGETDKNLFNAIEYDKAKVDILDTSEDIPSQKVRVAFYRLGDVVFELLEPTAEDGPVGKFLAKRGPGLHHVSLWTDDTAAALAACRSAGVPAIDAKTRPGAEGHEVAFLHPKAAGGVLIEISGPSTDKGPRPPAS